MNDIKEQPSYRGIRRFLPKSLFGRALLILVTPTVLVQLVTAYVFYERHWDSIVRNLSASLAGEIALLVQDVLHADEAERNYRAQLASQMTGMHITFRPASEFSPQKERDARFKQLTFHLGKRLPPGYPFTVGFDAKIDKIRITVRLNDAMMIIEVNKKRLVSSTTYIFILWVIGASLALLIIAILFLKNQIRPITELARAAEEFGMGHDPAFRPAGAREVRQAGHAFLTMRNRLKRQIASRTAMLSGISHDLKTPLTRMKLLLEMAPASEATAALGRDVEDMQRMVQEYLDFVRRGEGEEATPVDLMTLLAAAVEPHRRSGADVALQDGPTTTLELKAGAFRRAVDNLIVNALRYGGRCKIYTQLFDNHATIVVEDAGPGIPEEAFELVFKPFKRLDDSRDPNTGGAGLGLTIVQDIVRAHGGDVALKNLLDAAGRVCGLQVRVRLPLKRDLR